MEAEEDWRVGVVKDVNKKLLLPPFSHGDKTTLAMLPVNEKKKSKGKERFWLLLGTVGRKVYCRCAREHSQK